MGWDGTGWDGVGSYLAGREECATGELRENEEADEPTPREQLKREIVPERNKGEDEHGCEQRVLRPSERHVYIPGHASIRQLGGHMRLWNRTRKDGPNDPEVIGPVP